MVKYQYGELWNSLSEDEKDILLSTYKESKNKKNLVSHSKVMKKYEDYIDMTISNLRNNELREKLQIVKSRSIKK